MFFPNWKLSPNVAVLGEISCACVQHWRVLIPGSKKGSCHALVAAVRTKLVGFPPVARADVNFARFSYDPTFLGADFP
jgi:hypothetical protein